MENAVIYIAGNPNAYPVEYFDRETGAYCGLIPEMMADFAEKTGYDIRYYQPEKGDQRESLSDARQVDMISGCTWGEAFDHEYGQEIVLLEYEQDGRPAFYQLLLTEVAPESFKAELKSYVSELSQADKTALLLQTAQEHPPVSRGNVWLPLLLAGLVITALLTAILMLIRRQRRILSGLEESRETDAVTGIGNQEYLRRYYGQFINDRNRILYDLIYFYVDTERLDHIGGRKNTDEFLRYLAIVLRDNTADTDILSRVSDGGFVLLRLSRNQRESEQWLDIVMERLGSTTIPEFVNVARIAAGVYHLNSASRDLDAVIFDAAQCAQAAYRNGKDRQVCTAEALQLISDERQLQKDIKRGLADGEFELYIQFCVDPATGRIVGGQALTRWNHPDRGLLLPGSFVPLMEREGLIPQVDYCALRNSCGFLESLEKGGERDFFLICNFSRETFAAEDFLPRCREIVNSFAFDKKRLVFEITQGALKKPNSRLIENIAQLQQAGVRVLVDGRSFVCSEGLHNCRPDMIKLDKELIGAVGTEAGESILRSMLKMCGELDMTVLAQGVETAPQEEFLRGNSCGIMQGFRFYQPLPQWLGYSHLMAEHR